MSTKCSRTVTTFSSEIMSVKHKVENQTVCYFPCSKQITRVFSLQLENIKGHGRVHGSNVTLRVWLSPASLTQIITGFESTSLLQERHRSEVFS